MRNIIDYVRSSTDSFLERPFGLVDSLVLAQLVMLRFEHFIPGIFEEKNEALTLADLARREDVEKIFLDVWHNKNARMLFNEAVSSPRFSSIAIRRFVKRYDEEAQTQFAAIIYSLSDGTDYIAYRGTDETFVAWKEDFNMAFMSPVPA